uniref:Uncharacterized protein n=1 Tax=Alexandrium monilatum TaxID=311494 RepID=A0A7S4R0D7_9DINO|mmetsp:Transcript_91772/g.291182  ORF Transcript_91772/g.291182 Transcript_91772/m.291182 type:complete len:591 (-) Transcript_91772:82-1854(-)|eukprot:CAMPEP_0175761892 /NCGR_PEP_ID=MMETSP0097-20121207/66904_1 /TAXON_ID=311494 /ORGANISM="Alexandrium monilatum, Strain CCMP3105" /LENGTH=590 /DNA_ID=CAMNT_0017071501 /DNA_START=42 /DNA_END=1814 /DNA_ORIENTATION=-
MPLTPGSSTSRERSPTPEGSCPIFDFKDLDVCEPYAKKVGSDGSSFLKENEGTRRPASTCEVGAGGGAPAVNIYPLPDERSTPVLGRYSRNENVEVFEWDEGRTWRRCRTKHPEGSVTKYGWVKVLTNKYGPLMVPNSQVQQLMHLCRSDTSGVLRSVLEDECESNVQKHVPDMLRGKKWWRMEFLRTARRVRPPGPDVPLKMDDGRLVLGPWPRPVPTSKTVFRRALVMGAHHTCTTALTRELEAQFFVKVENNYDTVQPDARPENHKHRIMEQPPSPPDALIVCLVKEPCFWLQSLTRHAATYAIRALQEMPDGSYEDMERHVGPMEERSQEELLDAILGPVEFFGDIYPDGGALSVWEASVRSYFDEEVYPLRRTAVVRCEDFLFNFEGVMQALSELGLQRRPVPPPPDSRRAKGGVVHFKARDREEALCWYGDEANRHVGLQPRHVASVAMLLGDLLLGPLGYGKDAISSWSSRPQRFFIAGSWNQYRPVPMVWDGERFIHSLQLGPVGEESFQILWEASWDAVYYPSDPDACPGSDHEILGPDSQGHGKNWTVRDRARRGRRCQISVEVDPTGAPVQVSVDWMPT